MGFFKKIAEGIKKTKDNISKKLFYAFSARALDDEFYESLEEALLAGDVGVTAAESIVEAAAKGPFLSQDDFRTRTKVSKTVVDKLVELGILKGLPESNQLSLFDLVS